MNTETIYATVFCILAATISGLLVKFNVIKIETSINSKFMLLGISILIIGIFYPFFLRNNNKCPTYSEKKSL
ncbi:hypothetical protein E4K43_11040 [Neisseria meningitidis]|nr:hypothetical protein [Neisseria meningitidis]